MPILEDYGSVIYHIISWLITFILVCLLCTPITNFIINNTSLDEKISSKIEIKLENLYGDNFDSEKLISSEETGISESILNVINEYFSEAIEKNVSNIAGYIAVRVTDLAIYAIVATALFIFARFVSALIGFALEFVVALPIFHTFNRIGRINLWNFKSIFSDIYNFSHNFINVTINSRFYNNYIN